MLEDDLATPLLEEDGALLLVWVQLAVDEDAGLDVLLRALAKDLVLAHDALVGVADEEEVLLGGVAVAPHLVIHDAFPGRLWHKLLDEEEVLCDGEGDVREAVCRANFLTKSFAVLGGVGLVLNVVALGVAVDIVGLEVDEAGSEIGVGGGAVVALIEVICEDLPIEGSDEVPGVVELVVIKVELVEAGLLVDVVKSVLPCYLGLLVGVHVDPDETVAINAHVNGF